MKKHIICFALLLMSMAAAAQNGLLVWGEAGIGNSNVMRAPNYALPTNYEQQHNAQNALTAVVGAGMYSGQWEFKAGLGYLRDGYVLTYDDPANGRIYRDAVFYPHIIVPFTIGWTVDLNSRWSIVPHWGVVLGINLDRSDLSDERTVLNDAAFNSSYHKLSAWVAFDVEARCNIGRNHFLFVAPHYNIMLTDIAKDANTVPEHNSIQFDSYTLNVGIARVFGER